MQFLIFNLILFMFAFDRAKISKADRICCCDYYNMLRDETLVEGNYICQGMDINGVWKVVRAMTTLKCYPIEEEAFDRYVWNYIYIYNCEVDFEKVRNLRNVRHLEANTSRLWNVEAIWKRIGQVPSVKLPHNRTLSAGFDFSAARFIDSLDLSHNEIEGLDGSKVFSPSTQYIYLNDNRIKFVHPKSFSYLYELIELHLENNYLKQIAFEFNFVAGEQKTTQVYINGNVELNKFTDLTIKSRPYHVSHIHIHNTSILAIPVPNLLNATVLVYSTFEATRVKSSPVNITYRSKFVNNQDRIDEIICQNNNKLLHEFDQKLLFGVNGTFSKVLKLSYNSISDLPILNLVDVRELDLENNLLRRLDNPTYLTKLIEVLNFNRNLIDYINEKFFTYFPRLRIVMLNWNKLYQIDSLYFKTDQLTKVELMGNKLVQMNRFVFLNQNATSLNNLNLDLTANYLSRLPRFYGNISRIDQLWMVSQMNDSIAVLGDNFFDNSYPFKMDNNKFIEPSHVDLNELHIWFSFVDNFTQNVFCLNESNFKANLIPRYFDIGSTMLDCRIICNLYLQLRLDKPLKVRLNEDCLGNLTALPHNRLNRGKIEFRNVSSNYYQLGLIKRLTDDMCLPYTSYTCGYSDKYLAHLRPNDEANSTDPPVLATYKQTTSKTPKSSRRTYNASNWQMNLETRLTSNLFFNYIWMIFCFSF